MPLIFELLSRILGLPRLFLHSLAFGINLGIWASFLEVKFPFRREYSETSSSRCLRRPCFCYPSFSSSHRLGGRSVLLFWCGHCRRLFRFCGRRQFLNRLNNRSCQTMEATSHTTSYQAHDTTHHERIDGVTLGFRPSKRLIRRQPLNVTLGCFLPSLEGTRFKGSRTYVLGDSTVPRRTRGQYALCGTNQPKFTSKINRNDGISSTCNKRPKRHLSKRGLVLRFQPFGCNLPEFHRSRRATDTELDTKIGRAGRLGDRCVGSSTYSCFRPGNCRSFLSSTETRHRPSSTEGTSRNTTKDTARDCSAHHGDLVAYRVGHQVGGGLQARDDSLFERGADIFNLHAVGGRFFGSGLADRFALLFKGTPARGAAGVLHDAPADRLEIGYACP